MVRSRYRVEFEREGVEKVRKNVELHPNEAEKQQHALQWLAQQEDARQRTRENRLEIAAWLAALFAFIAAFFGVVGYFS
jgi:hypothetical protein